MRGRDGRAGAGGKMGKVFLVGAGPGDPGLITVRGLQCIREADVIVYDRLATPRLLSEAQEGAELVYVGKRPDRHTLRQEEINNLLVARAGQGKVVARLKGGDPFIFGRGGEEAEALAAAGIPFEVVPGVSSVVAVPAYAGIPLTHRDWASSVAFVTGHEDPAKDRETVDWRRLGADTLVILMGMGNIEQICSELVATGRPGATPVAVIRWGTRAEQRTVVGTLETIAADVRKANLGPPAVIVVGQVATLRPVLSWYESKPLFGKRVLVTRSRPQASQLSRRVEELGGEAWEFPVIRFEDPEDWEPLDRAMDAIDTYDWLVFASQNGVQRFFRRWQQRGYDLRRLAGVRLAAIGPQTAAELRGRGLIPDMVPDEYRAEALLAGFEGRIAAGQRVLLARTDIGRPVLREGLLALGAGVDEVVVYRTLPADGESAEVRSLLKDRMIDIITFTSSATVRNFFAALGDRDVLPLLDGVTLACIGPVTAETLAEIGRPADVVASQYTIEGLVEAISRGGRG